MQAASYQELLKHTAELARENAELKRENAEELFYALAIALGVPGAGKDAKGNVDAKGKVGKGQDAKGK